MRALLVLLRSAKKKRGRKGAPEGNLGRRKSVPTVLLGAKVGRILGSYQLRRGSQGETVCFAVPRRCVLPSCAGADMISQPQIYASGWWWYRGYWSGRRGRGKREGEKRLALIWAVYIPYTVWAWMDDGVVLGTMISWWGSCIHTFRNPHSKIVTRRHPPSACHLLNPTVPLSKHSPLRYSPKIGSCVTDDWVKFVDLVVCQTE